MDQSRFSRFIIALIQVEFFKIKIDCFENKEKELKYIPVC